MRFKTHFNGYAVKFSPFVEGRLAVSTAQNYGIVGNGRQVVMEVGPGGQAAEVAGFDTQDGVYDCAWSEAHEDVLAAACGDGTVKLYDLAAPPQANPLRDFREHRHECCSVSWNGVRRELFLSSSWDDTIKLWTPDAQQSLATFTGHTYCVYQVAWSPVHGDTFLSASGDTSVRVWDARSGAATLVVAAHAHEVLSADWCKYNECLVASGSVDHSIKIWDLRSVHAPLHVLLGHKYAVRRVVFSPHSKQLLASCSYDMTVKLWSFAAPEDALVRSWSHHSEFAVGLDLSLLQEGLMASAGWDEAVCVWHMSGAP